MWNSLQNLSLPATVHQKKKAVTSGENGNGLLQAHKYMHYGDFGLSPD